MRARRVAVLGAGVSGLATGILLAREGHDVTIVERDSLQETAAGEAPGWTRNGIPHFLQPHAFIPGARKVMLEHLGDVHADLLGAGASDIDFSRKAPGPRREGDEHLQYLGVRRPVIEWALRRAARREPNIRVIDGSNVAGLDLDGTGCRAVSTDRGPVDADVIVDAMGRRSPVRGWLADLRLPYQTHQQSDCGVIYYSRYYRLNEGETLPDGPWMLGPRGDLGYLGYSTFPGDAGTFAAVLAVPTGVTPLKGLRHEAAFESAVASIPGLGAWVNPGKVRPITPVLAMGGLQNVLALPEEGAPVGLYPVGDARGHTDPVLAHGMAFGLIHAVELARALRGHSDEADAGAAYFAATLPALRERFAFATDLDAQRLRLWTGGKVAFHRQDGDYALFSLVAAGAVALHDAEVFRVFVRRMGLLESTRVLDDDLALRRRIEERFAELARVPRPPAGPDRESMVALIEAAGPGH